MCCVSGTRGIIARGYLLDRIYMVIKLIMIILLQRELLERLEDIKQSFRDWFSVIRGRINRFSMDVRHRQSVREECDARTTVIWPPGFRQREFTISGFDQREAAWFNKTELPRKRDTCSPIVLVSEFRRRSTVLTMAFATYRIRLDVRLLAKKLDTSMKGTVIH